MGLIVAMVFEWSRAKIASLQAYKYIDAQTRLVSVEFVAYNPNMDYFVAIRVSAARCYRQRFVSNSSADARVGLCVSVQIMAEFISAGGVQISYVEDALRLYSFTEARASVVMYIVELIVILFYVYFMVVEVIKGCKRGCGYFLSVQPLWSASFVSPNSHCLLSTSDWSHGTQLESSPLCPGVGLPHRLVCVLAATGRHPH